MTVKIISGNLLDAFDRGEVDVIGHVVNCQGVMGSGIAKSVRERYPQVYTDYREKCVFERDSANNLGSAQFVSVGGDHGSNRDVVNLFAQNYYGTDKRYLNYGALAQSLATMSIFYWASSIGFPYKMGSDRAGGDFNIVLEMIEFYFKNNDVKIFKLED